MKTLVYHLSTPSYRQVEFGQAVRVDDRMPYVPDLNVKIVRTQEIYETAAQEDGSHQERALERHRGICRCIEVRSQQSFGTHALSKVQGLVLMLEMGLQLRHCQWRTTCSTTRWRVQSIASNACIRWPTRSSTKLNLSLLKMLNWIF